MAGSEQGTYSPHRMRQCPAPSISAASSSSEGMVFEEIQQEDHVIGRNRARQNQRPETAQQAQRADGEIGGDQAAAHQHGGDEKPHVSLPERQLVPVLGERIGGRDRQEQVDGHARQQAQQRIAERAQKEPVLENGGVGDRGEAHRQQARLAGGHGLLPGKGNRQHVDQGQQAGDDNQHHQKRVKHREDLLAPRSFPHIFAP